MKEWMETLNQPAAAYRRGTKRITFTITALAILSLVIIDPILAITEYSKFQMDVMSSFKIIVYGVISYLTICAVFWLVCRLLGSDTSFTGYLFTWGLSFWPNVVCGILVILIEKFYYVFWNSDFWSLILTVLFGMILIWKLILYIIYLKEIAKLSHRKFWCAFLFIGIIIAFLAAVNGKVGIKSPIL